MSKPVMGDGQESIDLLRAIGIEPNRTRDVEVTFDLPLDGVAVIKFKGELLASPEAMAEATRMIGAMLIPEGFGRPATPADWGVVADYWADQNDLDREDACRARAASAVGTIT